MSAFNEIDDDDDGPAFSQEATAEAISGHTPGPWLAFQANSEVGTNYWRIRTAPPESGLLDTIGGYCGEANARLIAAAPDLLEALKDMLSGWRYIRQDPKHLGIYGVGWDRAQFAAEAAIDKAEGGAE